MYVYIYIFYLILQCPQWKGGGTLSTMKDPLYHDLYNIQVRTRWSFQNSATIPKIPNILRIPKNS